MWNCINNYQNVSNKKVGLTNVDLCKFQHPWIYKRTNYGYQLTKLLTSKFHLLGNICLIWNYLRFHNRDIKKWEIWFWNSLKKSKTLFEEVIRAFPNLTQKRAWLFSIMTRIGLVLCLHSNLFQNEAHWKSSELLLVYFLCNFVKLEFHVVTNFILIIFRNLNTIAYTLFK